MAGRAPELRKQILELVGEYFAEAFPEKSFFPGATAVPVSGRVFDASELTALVDCSLDFWLTAGPAAARFEADFARRFGLRSSVLVNSGSSANLLAMTALTSSVLGDRRLLPGDEVVTVATGFPTTVNPTIQNQLVPVFVDVELPTYNVDVAQLEAAIGPRTRAIMLAHTLGNPFNLERVLEIAKKHDLWLVEDCCDAVGSLYQGKPVGTFGDLATVSFYPAHHITMGEGGAVFTNNAELKLIAESFRDWGRDCYCAPGKDNTCDKRFCWTKKQLGGDLPDGYDHKYTYSHLGYNLKISDMQAACALAQMDRVDEFIAARRENFAYLKHRLAGLSDFLHLPQATPNSEPSWFGFPLVVRESSGVKRADLINFLEDNKIGTRLLFAGNLTKQPYMAGRNFRVSGELTNTDIVMNQTFWLGTFPALGEPQLEYIACKLEEFFGVNF